MSRRVRQGVILIGGRGSRLGSLTNDTPKPLLEVAGRPFVEHVIASLSRFGIDRVLMLAGYRGAIAYDWYHGKRVFGAELSVSIEPEPLGTGGALKAARPQLDDEFLLTNGDSIFDTSLLSIICRSRARKCVGTILLRRTSDTSRYGSVELDYECLIRAFNEKRASAGGLMNAGVYRLDREAVLSRIAALPCSLERDVFPALAREGTLEGVIEDGYFVDMGLPESLEKAQRELLGHRSRPAAFLDRDGVLNVDAGNTHDQAALEWVDTAIDAVRVLNDSGYYVFLVTNQAGVAPGDLSECDVQQFNARMQDDLIRVGAHIDGFYHCPHHTGGKSLEVSFACECGKPQSSLLRQIAQEWPVDLSGSFLVGNSERDIDAARRFGIHAVRYDGRLRLSRLVSSAIEEARKGWNSGRDV